MFIRFSVFYPYHCNFPVTSLMVESFISQSVACHCLFKLFILRQPCKHFLFIILVLVLTFSYLFSCIFTLAKSARFKVQCHTYTTISHRAVVLKQTDISRSVIFFLHAIKFLQFKNVPMTKSFQQLGRVWSTLYFKPQTHGKAISELAQKTVPVVY